MNPFGQLLRHEWRILRRGRTIWILMGLAGLMGIYSLFYGKTVIDRQRDTLALLQQDERSRLDSLAYWATLDTAQAGNKAKWQKATDPYQVNVPQGYRYANHDPSALTPLSLGMRDLFPYYIPLMGRAVYRQVFQQEITNPQKLAVGHFDWAFVVVFMLPLLLIGLCYNVLSSEQEGGTYALLRAEPVTLQQIVGPKLLLRLGLLAGFISLITLLAVPVLGITDSVLLLKFWLISIAYLLFWGTLIGWVISWQRSSAVNALVLLGFWLVLVVALPALLQQWLTVSQPIDRSTFENLARDQYSQQQPDSVVLKPYYARHPALYFPKDTAKRDPDFRPYYARNEQVDVTLAPLVDRYNTEVAARESTVAWLDALLPAVNALDLFNRLAGTSAAAHRDYLRQLVAFHQAWNGFFVPKVFAKQSLTQADYGHLPTWTLRSTAPGFAIGGGLFKLLLASAVLFGVGWWKLGQ